MQRTMLKSKIHRATVTDADLNYEGSISIDRELCEKAELVEFERIDVYNCNNGARFSTYVIFGSKGQICLNGAAARHVQKGDIVIIASYVSMTEEERLKFRPSLVYVDSKNAIRAVSTDGKLQG